MGTITHIAARKHFKGNVVSFSPEQNGLMIAQLFEAERKAGIFSSFKTEPSPHSPETQARFICYGTGPSEKVKMLTILKMAGISGQPTRYCAYNRFDEALCERSLGLGPVIEAARGKILSPAPKPQNATIVAFQPRPA